MIRPVRGFYDDPAERENNSSPLNSRTLLAAFLLHAGIFLAFWCVTKIFFRPPDEIIPIDMTIVPPWAEQDPNDPEPDPNPPPKPEPEVKPPKPEPKVELPRPEDHVDALEKVVEKKKPEFKKGELIKPEKKPEEKKPVKKEFVRTGRLIKNPPPVKLPPGKGTSRDKPLSQAEIMKALASGARYGASNQLASSEEQRCVSLISRRFYEVWDLPGGYEGHVVLLKVQLRPGGLIVNPTVFQSSGVAALDQSAIAAARRAHHVNGLSADFIRSYPELIVQMRPDRQ